MKVEVEEEEVVVGRRGQTRVGGVGVVVVVGAAFTPRGHR